MTVFFVGATQFLFTGFLHFRRFFPSIFDECMCAPRNRRNNLWFRQNKIKIQATIPWHSIDFWASTRHKAKVNPFNGCRYIAPTVTEKSIEHLIDIPWILHIWQANNGSYLIVIMCECMLQICMQHGTSQNAHISLEHLQFSEFFYYFQDFSCNSLKMTQKIPIVDAFSFDGIDAFNLRLNKHLNDDNNRIKLNAHQKAFTKPI